MRKGKIMLIGLALLAVAAIGTTWAVWSEELWTGNEYMIPQYKTSLEEKFTQPDNWQPGVTTQKRVWVSNNVKDENGKSSVPAMAKVVIHQNWERIESIYAKDADGNNIEPAVVKPGDVVPFTFTDDDGKRQFAAIPNFNKENVKVLSSGRAKTAGMELGLEYVESCKSERVQGKWLLINEEPSEIGNYTLYYMGVLQPGEDSPVFLESVRMNPLLENTITQKDLTYHKTEEGIYTRQLITTSSKYGYDGCRYTMDIEASTVQATTGAVNEVFRQGVYPEEIIYYMANSLADPAIVDHSELPQKILSLEYAGGDRLTYTPIRNEKGEPEDPDNWFMSFTDMVPGGTYTDRMTVRNTTRNRRARIYMRIVPRENQTPLKKELLENITMKVEFQGIEIYNGKVTGAQYADGNGNLQELIPLCYLYPGESGDIKVSMYLNEKIALDRTDENGKCDLADQLAKIDWQFMIQSLPPGGNNPGGGGGRTPGGNPPTTIDDPDVPLAHLDNPDVPLESLMIPDEEVPLAALLPKTGDSRQTVLLIVLASISLLLTVTFGVQLKRELKRKEE